MWYWHKNRIQITEYRMEYNKEYKVQKHPVYTWGLVYNKYSIQISWKQLIFLDLIFKKCLHSGRNSYILISHHVQKSIPDGLKLYTWRNKTVTYWKSWGTIFIILSVKKFSKMTKIDRLVCIINSIGEES